MDLNLFFITVLLAGFAYYNQFIKIIREKSSSGVSIDSYLISGMAEAVMFFCSEVFLVKLIIIFHLFFSLFGAYLIYKYRTTSIKLFSSDFVVSLFFSFFMIFGVAQSLASFKNKSKYTNVSINSYLLFFILNVITLYLETNIYVLLSLCITNFLYGFIIIDTYLKKRTLKISLI